MMKNHDGYDGFFVSNLHKINCLEIGIAMDQSTSKTKLPFSRFFSTCDVL